jgi:tripartite-type tricarboxylate transporter receptor subunit TctC
MRKVTLVLLLLVTVGFFLFAGGAGEQATPVSSELDFPKKPITLVVGWDAGGSSDLVGRMIAQLSRKYLGVNMNVVNKVGGNGVVSLTELAKNTAPDGYTMAMMACGNFITAPYVSDVNFTMDDFIFVSGTTTEPLAVAVRSDSPLNNLQDVVDKYNKDKEPVMHAQAGKNSINHLHSIRMFNNMGVQEQIVPYSGAATAIAALLGGEVGMAIVHPGQIIANIQSGDIKLIAMVYKERVPTFGTVPTVEEQGFGAVSSEVYKALLLPAGTPEPVVKYLREGLNKITEDPEFLAFLAANAIEKSTYLDDTSNRQALYRDIERLWPVMEELKLLKPGAVPPKK